MQWPADSHRQPEAMIPFTFGPLPLRLLHNPRERTCMSSRCPNALLILQADYNHTSYPPNLTAQFLTACPDADLVVQEVQNHRRQ